LVVVDVAELVPTIRTHTDFKVENRLLDHHQLQLESFQLAVDQVWDTLADIIRSTQQVVLAVLAVVLVEVDNLMYLLVLVDQVLVSLDFQYHQQLKEILVV
tara:strand:+ start:104 stop:406 length:303 start_codon:yes stop_codon:yes gene_type:complete